MILLICSRYLDLFFLNLWTWTTGQDILSGKVATAHRMVHRGVQGGYTPLEVKNLSYPHLTKKMCLRGVWQTVIPKFFFMRYAHKNKLDLKTLSLGSRRKTSKTQKRIAINLKRLLKFFYLLGKQCTITSLKVMLELNLKFISK